jgi:hypothetical protein
VRKVSSFLSRFRFDPASRPLSYLSSLILKLKIFVFLSQNLAFCEPVDWGKEKERENRVEEVEEGKKKISEKEGRKKCNVMQKEGRVEGKGGGNVEGKGVGNVEGKGERKREGKGK